MSTSGVEKVEETEQNKDPETMEQEESKKMINPIRKSALVAILKSMLHTDAFEKEGFAEQKPIAQLHDFFVENLDLSDPQEENGLALGMFATMMELFTRWRDEHGTKDEEPLSSLFEVYESAKKTCNRCKEDTTNLAERSYGVKLVADTLRYVKYAFGGYTMEEVLRTSKIFLKMPCDKEGCGKEHLVFCGIEKLPSVFAIALEWEYNETKEEASQTTFKLPTEIDIKEIYKYEGGSGSTKYRLVSVVCKINDLYHCVAYKYNKWVIRYFGIPKEGTGDWNHFVNVAFPEEFIRPVILFFEQVVAE